MGNKKIFPLPLFLQLLQKNPVCIGYSVATGVVFLIPAIVFYYLWSDLKNEKKFWLWRLKKEEKKNGNLKLPKETYVTIFEEIDKQLKQQQNEER
jgi:hypothetical protein